MSRNRYYSGPFSDHFDGRFFNNSPITTDKKLADVLRWRRTSRPAPWPTAVPGQIVVPDERVENTRVTIVGHATVLVQTCELNLLTDPIWSERASPFPLLGPKRVCPPGIGFHDLPRIDVILLSHNHYDHLDIATLRRLVGRDKPLILTPLGNDTILRKAIADVRVTSSDWWGSHQIADDVEVTVVPAQHWSARGARDGRMALWGGFVIQSRKGSVYFVGDTGYGDGSLFRAIRQRFGAPDVALIPIGAYAPRWFMSDQHVDPDEAVMILQDLEARHAIAIHWGVFPLSDENRDEPAEALTRALIERGITRKRFDAAESGHVYDLVHHRS